MEQGSAVNIAAAIIACAADGDKGKIWDLVEGYEYALAELETRERERRERDAA